MKFALVVVGLVVVIQNVTAFPYGGCGGCGSCGGCGGCGGSGGSGGYGGYFGPGGREDVHHNGLEGLGGHGGLGTHGGFGSGRPHVPLVVRPQELPRPAVPLPASVLPVPGPCAIKKAIVKPAVLPRPICRAPPPTPCGCVGHSIHNVHCSATSTILGSCSGPVLGNLGGHGSGAGYATGAGAGLYGPNGGRDGLLGPSSGLNGPYGPGSQICRVNQANCAPADAVSLSLAYKMAQKAQSNTIAGEDRLHFGFRKIPKELPPKKVIHNNVPEEKIFSLNGQIVELKPVRRGSGRSLAEEAADDLLELQAEEDDMTIDGDGNDGTRSNGPRRVSLGELGYAPARRNNPTFVNVPAGNLIETAVDTVADAVSDVTGGSHGSHGKGCCGCCQPCSCKVIPGNVVYRTEPKPPQICLPPVVTPDSCESSELNISEEQPRCQCSCVPICVKKSHCCHKNSFTVQKFL